MVRLIIRRVLVSAPLLVVASFLCFALTLAMGDPLGEWKLQKPRPPGEIAAAEQRAGTDKPLLERYGHWAVNFAVRDVDDFGERAAGLGATILLAPFDTPGFRNSVIADPQGGVFAVSAAG